MALQSNLRFLSATFVTDSSILNVARHNGALTLILLMCCFVFSVPPWVDFETITRGIEC